MAIITPVYRDNRIVFSAEHFPYFRLSEVLNDSEMDEIVRSINLLPQLIAKLEEARDFMTQWAHDDSYRLPPDICAEIDTLVAEAKS